MKLKSLIFSGTLLLSVISLVGGVIADSASFTPPDVNSDSSGGGPTLTKMESQIIWDSEISWSHATYDPLEKTVNLGSHELCVLSAVNYDYIITGSWWEPAISPPMESVHRCKVYKSGGEYYLLTAGYYEEDSYSAKDSFTRCEAQCYD